MTETDPAPSAFRDSDPTLVDAAALWWAIQHTPIPEPSPAFRQWIRAPRRPRVALAIALALASTFIVVLAPVCWSLAHDELKAIDQGEAEARGRGWILLTQVWGVLITMLVATVVAGLAAKAALR